MNIDSLARKEVETALEKTKKALVKSHEVIVKDWKSDVGFRAAKYIRPGRMWVTVFPVGADRKRWFYVDLGTKKRDIKAKNKPYLTFRVPYTPKTLAKPARTVSGGGRYGEQWVRVKKVKDHEIKARHFTKKIAEDIQPQFRSEVENAFKRVANAGG